MSKDNCKEESRPELEKDSALERLWEFHPPMYKGKPDSGISLIFRIFVVKLIERIRELRC
jgi:hypothetical protein